MDPLKELEKILKPSMLTLIIGTLTFLAPYGHLILNILNKEYLKLMTSALLTFPGLILMTLYWCWHIYTLKTYKKTAKDIIEDFAITTSGQVFVALNENLYDHPSLNSTFTTASVAGNYNILRAWKWNDEKQNWDWYEIDTIEGPKWVDSPSAEVLRVNIVETIKADERIAGVHANKQPYYNELSMFDVLKKHENWYYQYVYKKVSEGDDYDVDLYYSPYPFSIYLDENSVPRLDAMDAPNLGVIYQANLKSNYYNLISIEPRSWEFKNKTIQDVLDRKVLRDLNDSNTVYFEYTISDLYQPIGATDIQNKINVRANIIETIKADSNFNYVISPDKYEFLPMTDVLYQHENDYFMYLVEYNYIDAQNKYLYHIYSYPEPFWVYEDETNSKAKLRIHSYGPDETYVQHSVLNLDLNVWSTDGATLGKLKGGSLVLGFINQMNPDYKNTYLTLFLGEGALPTDNPNQLKVTNESPF